MESILLLSEAQKYIMAHMTFEPDWAHGEPRKSWLDDDGVFCIEYDDGEWWHYRQDNASVIWWK